MHTRCLLLEGEGRLILIDCGIGEKYNAKFADIFAVDHDHSRLETSLRAAGFGMDDVTDVILTHLHFDHCGGATVHRGDTVAPAFRNATYHVQEKHLRWAQTPNDRERASFLTDNIAPIASSAHLHLLEGAGPLLPGIEVITVDGHTEAQQLVKVSGDEGTLVFVADLLPTSHHLRAPWIMAYDVRPLVTLEEKHRFLEAAEAGGWHLFFEHDPEVSVASVRRTERGFETSHPRSLEELF